MSSWSIPSPAVTELNEYRRWWFSEFDIRSSAIVDGLPNTGKTLTALYTMKRLSEKGNSSLYLAPSTLSMKCVAQNGAELSIKNAGYDTFCHHLNCPKSSYQYILIDDSHLYSLTQLKKVRQEDAVFLLFGDYSHPLLDKYYLGDDGLSDQELPPLEGVRALFDAQVFQLSPSLVPQPFVRLLKWYRNMPFEPNLSKMDDRVRVLKMNSLEEQCAFVKRFVEGTRAGSVCVAAFTRNTVMDALDSFTAIGLDVQAYLPGRDGVDTLDFSSDKPVLTTIKSMTGLHFEDVFILSFDKSEIWLNGGEAFEIAVTRAISNLTFFYTQELAHPLAALPKSFYEDNREKGVYLL